MTAKHLKIQNSHPHDAVMNVRMATNFPPDDRIVKDALAPGEAAHQISNERRMVIFSGEDRRIVSDQAASSYHAAAATRNSMCTVFGRLPFIKRFEEVIPSGSFLMSVAGDQATEENRQNLFKNFCNNDPFIHIFDDLVSSSYFLCARRAFNSNFCVIATALASTKCQVYERIGKLIVLSDLEKERTGWEEAERVKLVTIIHENVDVSEEFHTWFERTDKEKLLPVRGIDGLGMAHGQSGSA